MVGRISPRRWIALALAGALLSPSGLTFTGVAFATPAPQSESATQSTATTGSESGALPVEEATTSPETPATSTDTGSAEDSPEATSPVGLATAEGIERVEEADSRLRAGGVWHAGTSAVFSGGAYVYATAAGASVEARFEGTAVAIYGSRGPSYGKFEVFVDGKSKGVVDCYDATYAHSVQEFSLSGLSDAEHRITLRVLGTKNESSTATAVVFDALEATGAVLDVRQVDPELLKEGVEDTDQRLVWQGPWVNGKASAASGGTFRYASTIGSSLELQFVGSSVVWVGTMSPFSGTAEVFLDDVSQGTVDLYWPDTQYGQAIWFADHLTYGSHRLRIRATGERNASSGGPVVTIDRIATHEVCVPCYEETASRVTDVGEWTRAKSDAASGGAYVWSGTRESHIVVRFNGTSMRWYGPVGPDYGQAEVYLDGRLVGTVDQYASSAAARRVVWSVSGLADCQHAVVIRVLGQKSKASSGTKVAFDAAESVRGVLGTAEDWPARALGVEENDTRLAYTGYWVQGTSGAFSGGGYRYATAAGASVTARFTGSSVSLYGSLGSSYGQIRVYVDGVDRGVVDLWAESYQHGARLWSASGLAAGDHTLKVVVLGTKNEASTASTVVLDGMEASGGRFQTALDERSSSVSRSSGWTCVSSPVMLGGTYAYSRTTGSSMTLSMIGSSVSLIAPVGPSYGKVQVLIDGVSCGEVDLYASAYGYQRTVFEKTGLTDAKHTVVVRVLGKKNAASKGTTVVLDGFGATGEPVTRRGLMLATARQQLGKQYVWGGSGPFVFDCSGLTSYAYRSAGILIPHSSRIQFTMCSPQYREWGTLVAGDLVFTDNPSYIHHVGIYVGYGLTINAPGTGKFVEYRAAETYGCYGRLAPKYW